MCRVDFWTRRISSTCASGNAYVESASRTTSVSGELDEAQIPHRGAAIESQLPSVLRDAGPYGDEAKPQDESGPHAGFAPTFSVPCPSLPRLRFRAFSRLRLRALPCVPR